MKKAILKINNTEVGKISISDSQILIEKSVKEFNLQPCVFRDKINIVCWIKDDLFSFKRPKKYKTWIKVTLFDVVFK